MTPLLTALMPVAGTAPMTPQDIGQTIKDAVDQATREATQEARAAKNEAQQQIREAQQQVRDAQQQVRDAQQQLRDAQGQLRDARTPGGVLQRCAAPGPDDQRGAANQAIVGAQEGIRAAEVELRRVEAQTKSAPVVWTSQPPDFPFQRPTIPPQAVDIAIGFFVTCAVIVVGWPISAGDMSVEARLRSSMPVSPISSSASSRRSRRSRSRSSASPRGSDSSRSSRKKRRRRSSERSAMTCPARATPRKGARLLALALGHFI